MVEAGTVLYILEDLIPYDNHQSCLAGRLAMFQRREGNFVFDGQQGKAKKRWILMRWNIIVLD